MKKMVTKGLMSFVRACKHALVKIRDRVQTETLIFPIQIWSTFSDKKNIIHCRKSIKITICKTEMIFFVNNLLRCSNCFVIYIHIFFLKYSMKIRSISYVFRQLEILLCTKLNLFSNSVHYCCCDAKLVNCPSTSIMSDADYFVPSFTFIMSCDSIIDFVANSYFKVQIHHAKTFKMI